MIKIDDKEISYVRAENKVITAVKRGARLV